MSDFTGAAWTPRGCVELAHYGLPSMISHLFKGLLALELQNVWFGQSLVCPPFAFMKTCTQAGMDSTNSFYFGLFYN